MQYFPLESERAEKRLRYIEMGRTGDTFRPIRTTHGRTSDSMVPHMIIWTSGRHPFRILKRLLICKSDGLSGTCLDKLIALQHKRQPL